MVQGVITGRPPWARYTHRETVAERTVEAQSAPAAPHTVESAGGPGDRRTTKAKGARAVTVDKQGFVVAINGRAIF